MLGRKVVSRSAKTVERLLATSFLAALVAVTACTSGQTQQQTSQLSGRKATVVLGKDMSVDLGMDPARAFEEIDFLVLGNAYSRLVKFPYKSDGSIDFSNVVSDLAQTWTVSADAKTYTFHLNPKAKFAAGNALTAEDVRWSYIRLRNVNGPPGFLAANVDAITTPDPETVVITMKSTDPGFLKSLTSPNFAVLDSKVVKANGGTDATDADKTDKAEDFLSAHTYGSGPFSMPDYERGQKLVLQRVDNYWGGAPAAIKQFIVQNIPQPEVQAASLQRGDIDMTWNLIGQPDLVSQLTGKGFVLDKQPTLEWYDILFNADPKNNDAVAHEKVQLALKYAIDYEGLKHVCPVGSTRMAIAPPFVGGMPESQMLHEDLTKAKALLAEAGYANGFDVTLSGFKIGGICPTHEQIAIKLAQDWARIGVKATLDFKEFNAAIGAIRSGSTQIAFTGWIADYPDPADYAQYSTPVTSFAKRARWTKTARFTVDDARFPSFNSIVDLTNKMLAEPDPAKRLNDYHQLEQLDMMAGAIYPILEIDVANIAAPDLTGFHYNVLFKWDIYRFGRK